MGIWSGILAVLVLLGALPAVGQGVQVRGSVNHTTVGTQETLVYSLEVDGASLSGVETPSPPESDGLALVQRTPSVQRNMSLINGKMEQTVTFRWSYRPLREGTARLEAAYVTVEDRTYSTSPIEVRVVDQAQRPGRSTSGRQQWPFVLPSQPRADAEQQRDVDQRDLFIRAIPSATTARQNEQVTIEYRLYFRDGVQLRHSRLAGSWDAEGFWREEFNVDTRPVPTSVVENGILYHMIVLKRVAVFPTRPGTLVIDPLEIETEAYLPTGSSDPFERFFSLRGQFETVELASDPVELRVDPLPANAPPTFAGAVGSYRLDASVSRAVAEVGEPLQVSVTIQGSGNVATLDAPRFDPPGIFERYDPDVESTIDRDGGRIRGSKTFAYVLIPRSNGSFELPPIVFTYFDDDNGRYVTTKADLPAIRVTGTAAPLAAGTTVQGLPVDDIAPIVTAADSWQALNETPLYRRAWPYGALVIPIGLLLAFYAYQRRSDRLANDTRFARSRMAHPLARKHLRQAEKLLANDRPRAFYEEIDRAVTGFVGNRLNIAETGLTRDQIDARLAAVDVDAGDRRLLRALLEECDQARFAPVLPDREAMESARERAAHVIVAVDEAAERHRSQMAPA